MSIGGLLFSDLFVASEPQNCWFKPTPDSLTVMAVPEDCYTELAALRKHLLDRAGPNSFKVRWPAQGSQGDRLRVERVAVGHDETMFVCRRYRLPPGELGSLGVPMGIATKLMDKDLTSGLVVFFGKAGAGKSTAAGSFMCERLSKFGGVGWSVENPMELELQGRHGKGWCYQTEVADDSQIGPRIRQLMRATPNIILVGELRDGKAVTEAITAALSGHLVVTTVHAGDLISGIARLARLAQGVEKEMGTLLADALKVGMHLTLRNHDPNEELPPGVKLTGTPPRVLTVEPLWLTLSGSDAVKTIIRDGEFPKLVSEIDRQRRSLMMRGLPT